MSKIAFLGLGKMGSGMALRLLAAGHELRVFNRTAAKAAALASHGAVPCATPAQACAGALAVVAMSADDESSHALWCGPQGVFAGLAGIRPGAFAIECSTLSHDWVLDLSRRAAEHGLRYIDAPVTGLPDAAARGALTLLVGADSGDLASAQDVLRPLSERILHFGPVGAGTAYKLMINLVGAVQIASAAEGMAVAERAGLSLPAVADAIALGQAASPQVLRNTRRMVLGEHERDIVFTPALRLKDIEYALALARKLGVATPFGDVAARLFRELCAAGHAHVNESKILDVARQQPVA